MTRRILQSIQLDKIACVDRPCQEHAVVTIMKRDDGVLKKIADRLVKDLVVVPIPQSSGQDTDSFDYNQALEEVCECDAWCNAKEELRPFVHALKHSLISIYIDPNLRDNETRKVKIQEAVMQFLESIQLKFADALPLLDEQITLKRVRDLRATALGADILVKALIQKSMLVGKPDKPAKKIRKDWSHKARAAAAAARSAGRGGYSGIEPRWAMAAMARHHQKAAGRHKKSAGETKGWEQKYHNSMAQWHNNAATKQNSALERASSYAAFGKVEEKLAKGERLSHDEIALLQKAWSDKAREAAAEARRHRAKQKEHEEQAAKGAYGHGRAHHEQAADAHAKAADAYEAAAKQYGGSKFKTFAVGSLVTGGVGGLAGLGVRALQQRGKMRRARKLGDKAHGLSDKAYQMSKSLLRVHLIEKAWSDKAREAAARARRAKAKGKPDKPTHDSRPLHNKLANLGFRSEAGFASYGHKDEGEGEGAKIADVHSALTSEGYSRTRKTGRKGAETIRQYRHSGTGQRYNIGVHNKTKRVGWMTSPEVDDPFKKSLPRTHLIDKAKFHVSMKTPKGGRKNVTIDAKDKGEAHSKATAGKAGHKVFRIHGKVGKQRFPGGVDKPRRIGLKRSQGPTRGRQSPRDAVYLTRLGTHLPTGHPKGGRRNEGRLAGESGTIRKPMLVHKREQLKIRQAVLVKAILTKALEVARGAEILGWDTVEPEFYKVIGNTAADYIHDFVHSTNPRFAGKSKQERIRQALGAYYARNR